MKKGFTLVELSIVLVIVGLLVGGILIGQSMVNAAAMTKTVSMLAQFDAAAMSYKSQYKYLPGDNPNEPPVDGVGGVWAGSLGCGSSGSKTGYGDGLIDGGCFAQNGVNGYNIAGHFYGGIRQFWYMVSGRTFSLATPSGYISGGIKATQNAYAAPIAKKGTKVGFWVGCVGSGNNCLTGVNQANYYAITELIAIGAGNDGVSNLPAVTPTDTMALDQKLDDGLADSGFVMSGSAPGGMSTSSVSSNCSIGAVYTITQSDYTCIPIIRLGSSTGQKL